MDGEQLERENVPTEREDMTGSLLASAVPRGMKSSSEYDMDDRKRHFARVIVCEVFSFLRETEFGEYVAPLHESFCFTKEHKEDIRDFLLQNGNDIKKSVSESADEKGWKYDYENYLFCKRKILEDYKPKVYAEKDFVRLCAGIALVAIGNQTMLQNVNLIEEFTDELYKYIKDALKPGGTLQDSTWAED